MEQTNKQIETYNQSRLLVVCPANCSVCNGAGQCQQCVDGFATNGGVGACLPCHPTCLTCSTPNNDGTCLTCSPDSVLDGSNYCRTCPSYYGSYCTSCDIYSCWACSPGYYVVYGSSGGCAACNPSPLCLTCTAFVCQSCVTHY